MSSFGCIRGTTSRWLADIDSNWRWVVPPEVPVQPLRWRCCLNVSMRRPWDLSWQLKIKVGEWVKPPYFGRCWDLGQVFWGDLSFNFLPQVFSRFILANVFFQAWWTWWLLYIDVGDWNGSPVFEKEEVSTWKSAQVSVDTLLVGVLKQGGGVTEKAGESTLDGFTGCWNSGTVHRHNMTIYTYIYTYIHIYTHK